MIISDKHKFIFVHVPRTGGTSMRKVLKKYGKPRFNFYYSDDKHCSLVDLRLNSTKKQNVKYQKYYKFAFFRNPYEILVSLYHWHTYSKEFKRKHFDIYEERKNMTFYEWIDCNPVPQQTQWFCTVDGKIGVNEFYIYNKDKLQESFDKICEKIGIGYHKLPHVNKGKQKQFTEYYTDKIINRVHKLYNNDVKLWNRLFKKYTVKKD